MCRILSAGPAVEVALVLIALQQQSMPQLFSTAGTGNKNALLIRTIVRVNQVAATTVYHIGARDVTTEEHEAKR